MSLVVGKLENVQHRGSCINARCPACAENGRDNKGNHLYIDEDGRFSCVVYPGAIGHEHRKRIFALVGENDANNAFSASTHHIKPIIVRKATRNNQNVLKSNVLGHLGRVSQTLARTQKTTTNNIKPQIGFTKGVPVVPTTQTQAVSRTVEKLCKCGRLATDYAFDEAENEKANWIFFCSTCSPYQLDKFLKPTKTTTAKNTDKSCLRCGKHGERYVFDETKSGKYQYGFFCLECSPYHF